LLPDLLHLLDILVFYVLHPSRLFFLFPVSVSQLAEGGSRAHSFAMTLRSSVPPDFFFVQFLFFRVILEALVVVFVGDTVNLLFGVREKVNFNIPDSDSFFVEHFHLLLSETDSVIFLLFHETLNIVFVEGLSSPAVPNDQI